MGTYRATPQAVEDFVNARQALFRAFDFDRRQGVSANKIARSAAAAVSRPIVLAYLTAEQLRADAHSALKAAHLDATVGVEITGEIGRGSRTVHLTLAVDPQEIEAAQSDFVAAVTTSLKTAGIELDTSGIGSIGHALWDGELIPLRRS